ncbi:MAG: glycosyl transferase [Lachnospiraceae bacterium]|nr:glycosyl transferase [Lachnospiraceae bacterium]
MIKIAFFCIPAHGHTNPMLPVAAELVKRGNAVRFYSFSEFEAKIKATGAEFISCDSYLPELTEQEEAGLKNASTTEKTIQDIRITLSMSDFLDVEFKTFCPDVVYTDSVCFWGKLNAWKYDVPMVVSTSTFAFNQMSSQYMKNSPRELFDLIFGLPRVSRELNKLKAYGFKVKGLFSLIQSDNDTDSVVYTSKRFQPYSESFSSHYVFAGPSVFSEHKPEKSRERPLVYVSMGTVINDRPDFYSKCIDAMRGENVDLVISCGNAVDIASLGELPENVKVLPYVNQLEVLSKASVFITHCGMNSVSESLYMETPIALYPQTNEQAAVARRVTEIGAGMMLKDDSVDGIKKAVRDLIQTEGYAKAARECAEDFRNCPGIEGAADFVENAPHESSGIDIMKQLTKANVLAQVVYNIISVLLAVLIFHFVSPNFIWIYVVLAIMLSFPFKNWAQNASYKRLIRKYSPEGKI